MKLVSKLENGGDHPASGVSIPPAGQEFEVADERAALIPAELAVPVPPRRMVFAPTPAAPAEKE